VLAVDGQNLAYRVTGQQISKWQLPEFARDTFKQEAEVPFGVAQLEIMARSGQEVVQLQDSRMPDLVHYMNSQAEYGSAIHSMYWKVSSASIHGILDTIRTKLVALVAEMRAVGSGDSPTAEAANQAVNVVLHNAKRSTINVNTNQSASAPGAPRQLITTNRPLDESNKLPSWVSGPWGFAVGLATIVAAVVGLAAWLEWNPFR
jgi:microcystin-dependent protein